MIYYLSQAPIVYGLWAFFLFFLPILIFLKLTSVSAELVELKGLTLKPKLLNGNVVSISNNFDEFARNHPGILKSNKIMRLFGIICRDADNGKSYNPNLYISAYKATLQKFVFWILLGSHIPLLFLILIIKAPVSDIAKYQVCSYILVYILEMIIQYRHSHFTRFFYTNWYNKILNFDLITVKLIREDVDQIRKLSNSHDLLEVIAKFNESNAYLANSLTQHSDMLNAKFNAFIEINRKTEGINSQSVLLSLDDYNSKYDELNGHIREITQNMQSSLDSIMELTNERKDEINIINKNTELLSEIRERFKNYQSEAISQELSHLQAITNSLDNNVNKAFTSATKVIEQNFERLEEGYNKFFDVCKSLSESVSSQYEEKTASALTLLFGKLESEFKKMKENTENQIKVVQSTSEATALLCKTVYDFTQYTTDQNFMNKIAKFTNFSNSLKLAAERLISFEKLAALWEVKDNEPDK